MITRKEFFDALAQRKAGAEAQTLDPPQHVPNMLQAMAHVLYARFLGTQLNMTNGYGVFSTGIGHMIWEGKSLVPGFAMDRPRDEWNKGRVDLTWSNLSRPNCLPPPESMTVGGIMVALDCNTSSEELQNFQRNIVGRFVLGGKCVREVPMRLAASVTDGDLTDIVTDSRDRRDEEIPIRNSGTPTANLMPLYFPLHQPIVIEPLQHFDFVLEKPHPWDAPEDLGGWVFFDGVKYFAVS